MTQSWSVLDFKKELASFSAVRGWVITQEMIQRRERYLMQAETSSASRGLLLDQDRESHTLNLYARVMVSKKEPGRQGEIYQKFFRDLPLRPQIEVAVRVAAETDVEAWTLPDQLEEPNWKLESFDPRIAEDLEGVIHRLSSQMESASKHPGAKFNSAELFVALHDYDVHYSNGIVHRFKQSRLYGETAFSAEREIDGQVISDEYLETLWSVDLDRFCVEALFDSTAQKAQWMLQVERPASGRYSVIVGANVLGQVFSSCLGQLSGASVYQKLPHRKLGEEFVPQASGDLFSIRLDPTLRYGAGARYYSPQGVPQQAVDLVKDNRVVQWAMDQQHASYLKTRPTVVRGDIVVAPGQSTFEQMTRSAPQVLEILQFSGLFVEPNTATFSSEIRLARLFDNRTGCVTYVKGGSLSASLFENFTTAQLSVDVDHWVDFTDEPKGYFGPKHALMNDVSVVSE